MCYATKRKIANCVKDLMRRKDIRKITIQDVMDATEMSRQSFYYHFKDIYDVLEWIGLYDFEKQMEISESENVEEWVLQLFTVLHSNRFFFEKMVKEVEWTRILECVKSPIETRVVRMFSNCGKSYVKRYSEEWKLCVEFFTKSFSYYLMDYVYHRKELSNEEILLELRFLISILEGSQLVAPTELMTRKVIAV